MGWLFRIPIVVIPDNDNPGSLLTVFELGFFIISSIVKRFFKIFLFFLHILRK